jgi:hypothetical protein
VSFSNDRHLKVYRDDDRDAAAARRPAACREMMSGAMARTMKGPDG